jgi:4-hydroxyproline epimerase
MQKLILIDTHTGGEPTRVLFDMKLPDEIITVSQQRDWLREKADWIRRSILHEPRGSESMVGAMVGPPANPANHLSVVFFNNTGYLGMCGHGLLGVIEAMRYREGWVTGSYVVETVAGDVRVVLHDDRTASFENVRSDRYRTGVSIEINPGESSRETVTGDIAYGGNWFFLTPVDEVNFSELDSLTRRSTQIRDALQREGITGRDNAEIDHIELYASLNDSTSAERGGRNFVLCPGGHYDRSPCGTGTSAKLACLAAEGNLAPGEAWIQESVVGSRFVGTYQHDGDGIRATITGRAHVMAETVCIFDPEDAYRFGIAPCTPTMVC